MILSEVALHRTRRTWDIGENHYARWRRQWVPAQHLTEQASGTSEATSEMRTRIGKETLPGGAAVSRADAVATALARRGAAATPRQLRLGQIKGREKVVWGGRTDSIFRTPAAGGGWFRARRTGYAGAGPTDRWFISLEGNQPSR